MLSISPVSFNTKANQKPSVNVKNSIKLHSQPTADTISFGTNTTKIFSPENAEKFAKIANYLLKANPHVESGGNKLNGYLIRNNNIEFVFQDPAQITSKLYMDFLPGRNGKSSHFDMMYIEWPDLSKNGIIKAKGIIDENTGFSSITEKSKEANFDFKTLNDVMDKIHCKNLFNVE